MFFVRKLYYFVSLFWLCVKMHYSIRVHYEPVVILVNPFDSKIVLLLQKMVLLNQMPNEVLETISKHLDFRSILTSRKVCHDLRNFVDDVAPPSSVIEISIRINAKRIALSFKDSNSEEKWTEIKYKNNRKGCSTVKNTGEKKMKKQVGKKDLDSFESIFWEDFKFVLKHQKSILDKFGLVFEHYEHKMDGENLEIFCKDVMEKFKTTLKTRPRPLQAKVVDYGIKSQLEVLTVLPYIDPSCLKKIVFGNSQGHGHKPLQIGEIVKLEQWKKAKEVNFNEFWISEPVQSFVHFSKVMINSIYTVTTETIRILREMFRTSPTINHFEIYYNPNREPQDLRTLFGHRFDGSYTNEDGGARWYFKIPNNTEDVISIQSNLFSWLVMSRMKISELPKED